MATDTTNPCLFFDLERFRDPNLRDALGKLQRFQNLILRPYIDNRTLLSLSHMSDEDADQFIANFLLRFGDNLNDHVSRSIQIGGGGIELRGQAPWIVVRNGIIAHGGMAAIGAEDRGSSDILTMAIYADQWGHVLGSASLEWVGVIDPTGQTDYGDERYWVRRVGAVNAIGDDTEKLLTAILTNDMAVQVTATNLAERVSGTHLLDTGGTQEVLVRTILDARDVEHHFFSQAPPSGLELVVAQADYTGPSGGFDPPRVDVKKCSGWDGSGVTGDTKTCVLPYTKNVMFPNVRTGQALLVAADPTGYVDYVSVTGHEDLAIGDCKIGFSATAPPGYTTVLAGKFPVGYKAGDPDFGAIGGTGGNSSHSHADHTADQVAAAINDHSWWETQRLEVVEVLADTNLDGTWADVCQNDSHLHQDAANTLSHTGTGANLTHDTKSNLPPYEVVAFWKRTD